MHVNATLLHSINMDTAAQHSILGCLQGNVTVVGQVCMMRRRLCSLKQ